MKRPAWGVCTLQRLHRRALCSATLEGSVQRCIGGLCAALHCGGLWAALARERTVQRCTRRLCSGLCRLHTSFPADCAPSLFSRSALAAHLLEPGLASARPCLRPVQDCPAQTWPCPRPAQGAPSCLTQHLLRARLAALPNTFTKCHGLPCPTPDCGKPGCFAQHLHKAPQSALPNTCSGRAWLPCPTPAKSAPGCPAQGAQWTTAWCWSPPAWLAPACAPRMARLSCNGSTMQAVMVRVG